jgi:membrane dipeptidase
MASRARKNPEIDLARIESARRQALKRSGATEEQLRRGLALHRRCLVFDSFGFAPQFHCVAEIAEHNRLVEAGYDAEKIVDGRRAVQWREMAHDKNRRAAAPEILRRAGVTGIAMPVGKGNNPHASARMLSHYQYYVDHMAPVITKALCAEDIRRAKREGRFVYVFELNSPPVAGKLNDPREELEWLPIFHRLGVRAMHLTYNRQNLVGAGCTEREDHGLSSLGREVVKMLNELGVIVDVPHSSRRTVLDACEVSSKPVLSSHTCCRAVFDHIRGRTDEEIRALAATGGAIGIVGYSAFLAPGVGRLDHLLDHVDHAVQLVGPEHVCIGTDNNYSHAHHSRLAAKPLPGTAGDWYGDWPPGGAAGNPERAARCAREQTRGSLTWTNWPYFTAGLLARGYAEEDIAKIIGLNYLRIFETCCG